MVYPLCLLLASLTYSSHFPNPRGWYEPVQNAPLTCCSSYWLDLVPNMSHNGENSVCRSQGTSDINTDFSAVCFGAPAT